MKCSRTTSVLRRRSSLRLKGPVCYHSLHYQYCCVIFFVDLCKNVWQTKLDYRYKRNPNIALILLTWLIKLFCSYARHLICCESEAAAGAVNLLFCLQVFYQKHGIASWSSTSTRPSLLPSSCLLLGPLYMVFRSICRMRNLKVKTEPQSVGSHFCCYRAIITG